MSVAPLDYVLLLKKRRMVVLEEEHDTTFQNQLSLPPFLSVSDKEFEDAVTSVTNRHARLAETSSRQQEEESAETMIEIHSTGNTEAFQ
jgi:hypothetical protein